ncbi:MAG TPA: DUF6782 family putative metallopeptidase [Patescibacteria group bacterium]|nr:DUF6782 family putative metallopeptidase [Patescibacteria group bacterium]
MDVKNVRQPGQWKRDNLELWRAGHSSERQEKDRQQLAELFNLAAEVPVLKDALDWARDHDIEFIVDHTTRAAGYYFPGTGVVGISRAYMGNTRYIAGVLVHEIRHAWQDYYGMIPTAGKNFADYFMREALIEADATAHQDLAMRQYDLSRRIARLADLDEERAPERKLGARKIQRERLGEKLAQSAQDTAAIWESFGEWFKSWKPGVYGDAAIRRFAITLGVSGIEPKDYKFEYDPYDGQGPPSREGIDASRAENLRELGKSFNDVNYFDADGKRSLSLEFATAARASSFYSENNVPDPLVEEVRRRWLQLEHQAGHDVTICPPYNF